MSLLLVVAVVGWVLAGIMGAVAWRMVREEQRRSEARVRTLAAEIHRTDREGGDGEARPSVGVGDLFIAADRPRVPARAAATVAIGAFVVASAVALVVVLSAGTRTANPAPVTAAVTTPLELVALHHERDEDRLMVEGIVRNPNGAAAVDGLTAVVFVFGHDGAFLGSARASVETATLSPGTESAFVVPVQGAAEVARYRVSFRAGQGVVPHVDRRARAAEAPTRRDHREPR